MEDRGFWRFRKSFNEEWFDEVGKEGRIIENMVLVRADRSLRTGWFRHDDLALKKGDRVVVETDRGTTSGTVASDPEKRWTSLGGSKGVLRKLDPAAEKAQAPKTKEREEQARRACSDLIWRLQLDMKLIEIEFVPWENRVVFYFVSEGRIDFRELVKELSRILRCRVEMRQIGPRDETKMLGGMGRCGRELCCRSHLAEFTSVRTKMAKEQGLPVNQEKITGHCRKLLCCLAYERDVYAALRQDLPRTGTMVDTPDGPAKVVELKILKQAVKVAFPDGGGFREFPVSALSYPDKAQPVEEAAGDSDPDEPEVESLRDLEDEPEAAAEQVPRTMGASRKAAPLAPRPRGERPPRGDERRGGRPWERRGPTPPPLPGAAGPAAGPREGAGEAGPAGDPALGPDGQPRRSRRRRRHRRDRDRDREPGGNPPPSHE